jgi:hypothetical protein
MGINSRSREKKLDPELAVKLVAKAVKIREEIDVHYGHYHGLTKIALTLVKMKPHDFKRAVDAIYYLGGAGDYPDRLAAFLDNFGKLYKLLTFLGHANEIDDYLMRNFGIKVSITAREKLKVAKLTHEERVLINTQFRPKTHGLDMEALETNLDVVRACFNGCLTLQGSICGLADKVKDDIKPKIEDALLIQPPEFQRFFGIAKAKIGKKTEERQARKKKGFDISHDGMKLGFEQLKTTPIKTLLEEMKT